MACLASKSPGPAPLNLVLSACAREAARANKAPSYRSAQIMEIATAAWKHAISLGSVERRSLALMYRICGLCRDLQAMRNIRQQVADPSIGGVNHHCLSSDIALAAYLLCLGRCSRSVEAEELYFSRHNANLRTCPMVIRALFEAFVACNRLSKAEGLIVMYGPSFLNLQACNAFVAKCARLQLHETGIEFVQRMWNKEAGYPGANARTYNVILRGLSAGTGCEDRMVAAERVGGVVEEMRMKNIEPTTATYNCVIRSFVLRDEMKQAMRVFDVMRKPNRITLSHLMIGAAKTKDLDLAKRVMELVRELKEGPNYGVCKAYLEVLACQQGVGRAFIEAKRVCEEFGDVVVFGDVGCKEAVRMALIRACGRAGELEAGFAAVGVRLGDGSHGEFARLYVATVLMQACLDCKAVNRALEVFSSLKQAGIQPNFEVYESLIYGLCCSMRQRAMDDEEVEDDLMQITLGLVGEMHACGEGRRCTQAAYVYNSLIAAAAARGDDVLAHNIFRRMAGHNSRVQYVAQGTADEWADMGVFDASVKLPVATVGTYNAVMWALAREGKAEAAFNVLYDMLKSKREPNVATFGLLLDLALANGNDIPGEMQARLLREVRRATVPRDVERRYLQLQQRLVARRCAGA